MKKRGNNSKIAEIFYKIADIYELKKVKWKPQAYRIAAQTLESMYIDLRDIYKKEGEKAIDSIPGIGQRLTKKIVEYLKTGKIKEYKKLKKSVPAGLCEMMDVPGIGVKKASLFYYKLGIKNVRELKKAAKEHKLENLPGFKKRAEEKVLEGIEIKKGQPGRIPLKDAEKSANQVLSQLKKLPEIMQAVIGGSIRRKKSTVKDIDIIIKTKKPKEAIEKFTKMNFVKRIIGKGEKKGAIINSGGIEIDLRAATPEEFAACLIYFTGDKQHNIWLRRIAIKKGWKLNEYGLFDKKTGKRIDGKSEAEIYKKLGIKMPEPKDRIGETG